MIAGQAQLSNRADVDGSGQVDGADLSLIQSALGGASGLPAWWNRLPSSAQRNAWVDQALALDRTNAHPIRNGWGSPQFSIQLFINFSGYRDDLSGTFFSWGQKGFNLPVYIVSVSGPTTLYVNDAILVGDNPLNLTHWRFFEPQTGGAMFEALDQQPQAIQSGKSFRKGSCKKRF